MFDLDGFVSDCLEANKEAQPRLAIKEILDRAVSRPEDVAAVLPPDKAEIARIHVSPELTIIKVVWAPGMSIRPHDHRMWATIGNYTGGEDNTFYRRAERGLSTSGGKELRPGDVCLLGDDTIHAVHNPTRQFAGAIHIYGGDFFTKPRSEWETPESDEQPFDVDAQLRRFAEANESASAAR